VSSFDEGLTNDSGATIRGLHESIASADTPDNTTDLDEYNADTDTPDPFEQTVLQYDTKLPAPDPTSEITFNDSSVGILRRAVCAASMLLDSSEENRDEDLDEEMSYEEFLQQPLAMERDLVPVARRARVLPASSQYDVGSNCNVTNNRDLLRDFRELDTPMPMACADDREAPLLCTGIGIYDLHNSQGETLPIPMYYSAQLAETLISPDHICNASEHFKVFETLHDTTTGYGWLKLRGPSGLSSFTVNLYRSNSLWYLDFVEPVMETSAATARRLSVTGQAELWHARLGHPSLVQLEHLPKCSKGLPTAMKTHPFHFCDVCYDARQSRTARNMAPEPDPMPGERFHMDFGFMRASSEDYKPDPAKPRVVESHEGYNSYLLAVDAATRYTWVFLCKSKEPPIDILKLLLKQHGTTSQAVKTVRVDQGGELGRSSDFRKAVSECGYIMELTGSDSAFQNGRVERLNRTFGVMVRSLLYASGLAPVFWSDALVHAEYLKNRLWHSALGTTPYEAFTGTQPDLTRLRTFGSLIKARVAGEHAAKLDKHTFHGVFLGYTATNSNIRYYDLKSKRIKTAYHADYDEAHYTSSSRPPGPQLLYDLGLKEVERADVSKKVPITPLTIPVATYPPNNTKIPKHVEADPCQQHLPLAEFTTYTPSPPAAAAARLTVGMPFDSGHPTVTMSDDPLKTSFAETLPIGGKDPTAGLVLQIEETTGRVKLLECRKGTPTARIPRWRSRLRHAYLLSLDGKPITSLDDAAKAIAQARQYGETTSVARFAFDEIRNNLTDEGVPQLYHDQLNIIQKHLTDIAVARSAKASKKLTRRYLQTQLEWKEWEASEFKLLDQYHKQDMFGDPIPAPHGAAVFDWVWDYKEKVDGTKKARGVCNGSPRAGKVESNAPTYAACVDQTGSRVFYATCALEGKLVFGSDVSNAFAEAPGPSQTFYMRVDKVFQNWWTNHLGRPPIPPGYVLPVRRALQGHPESPRLWSIHIDQILTELGFVSTTHEPCVYRGKINGQDVLFLRQVDDFACGVDSQETYDILCDLLDARLLEPIKRLGLIEYFNGVTVEQTAHYIKLSSSTYIDKILQQHDFGELHHTHHRPIPMNDTNEYCRKLDTAEGPTAEAERIALAEKMTFSYRQAIGELIWAMITCRPDISFATVKLSQFASNPAEIHYKAVKDVFRYLRATKDFGIYYWKEKLDSRLPTVALPSRYSNETDVNLTHDVSHIPSRALSGYVDSDWASDIRHRRSVSGIGFKLAGGVVAYKTRVQSTVSTSSAEAEFQAASDAGKMALYIRSILDELGVPQENATCIFEDNKACVYMANASRPTKNTRHMEIRHFSLQRMGGTRPSGTLVLEHVPTALNESDVMTKALSRILFYRHVEHLMGRVPPTWSAAAQG